MPLAYCCCLVSKVPLGRYFTSVFVTVGIFITVPIIGDLSSCLNLKAKKCSKVGIWEQTNKKMMTINDNSWATLAHVKKVQEVKLIVQKITKYLPEKTNKHFISIKSCSTIVIEALLFGITQLYCKWFSYFWSFTADYNYIFCRSISAVSRCVLNPSDNVLEKIKYCID